VHINPIYFDGDLKAEAIIHLFVFGGLFCGKRLISKEIPCDQGFVETNNGICTLSHPKAPFGSHK
jgi:hypothetical protein